MLTMLSIQFAGDSIVSKAHGENTIVVWQIDSFNSDLTPPEEEAHHVTPQTPTVSSFGGKFQRLQTLQLPGTGPETPRSHFALVGRHEPVVIYGDIKGIYSWNLAQAAEEAKWDPFEAVGPDYASPANKMMPGAPWAWAEPVQVAAGNGGMYIAVGMMEGLVCLLLCRGHGLRRT
jgi:hypothetical protein